MIPQQIHPPSADASAFEAAAVDGLIRLALKYGRAAVPTQIVIRNLRRLWPQPQQELPPCPA